MKVDPRTIEANEKWLRENPDVAELMVTKEEDFLLKKKDEKIEFRCKRFKEGCSNTHLKSRHNIKQYAISSMCPDCSVVQRGLNQTIQTNKEWLKENPELAELMVTKIEEFLLKTRHEKIEFRCAVTICGNTHFKTKGGSKQGKLSIMCVDCSTKQKGINETINSNKKWLKENPELAELMVTKEEDFLLKKRDEKIEFKCKKDRCSKTHFKTKYTIKNSFISSMCSDCSLEKQGLNKRRGANEKWLKDNPELARLMVTKEEAMILKSSDELLEFECSNEGCLNRYLKNRIDAKNSPLCKGCSNRLISLNLSKSLLKQNGSLQDHFPEIASQLHPEKNGGVRACDISPHTTKKYWWICPQGIHRDYKMGVSHRTSRGQGCPKCRDFSTSQLEKRLFCEFKSQGLNVKLRENICGKEADLFFEDLNLIIEVDGYRWHSKPEKKKIDIDKQKTWEQAGYTVIRIRENRLDALGEYNIFYNQKCPAECFSSIRGIIIDLSNYLPLEFSFIAKHYEETQSFFDDAGYQKLKLQSYSNSSNLVTREKHSILFDELNLEKHTFKELEMCSIGSDKVFFWLCKNCGHDWKASIYHRATRGQGCVKCSNWQRVLRDRMKSSIEFFKKRSDLKYLLAEPYEEAIKKNCSDKVKYFCSNRPDCSNIYLRCRNVWRTNPKPLCKGCRQSRRS